MLNLKRLILLIFGLLISGRAMSYTRYLDDTRDHIRLTDSEEVIIVYCSMSGDEYGSVIDAIFAWNDPSGAYDRIEYTTTYADCGDVHISDAKIDRWSHIAGWPAGHSYLDGFPGISKIDWVVATGSVQDFDIGFDRDRQVYASRETDTNLSIQEILIHEFGHPLGMDHENDEMSVMCSKDTCGKMAAEDIYGNTDAVTHYDSNFADDTEYMFKYQNNGATGRIDPYASAWYYDGSAGKGVRFYNHNSPPIEKCPGDWIWVNFSIGNKGKVAFTSANPISYGIYFSAYNTIGTGISIRARVGSAWDCGQGCHFQVGNKQVYLPTNLLPGWTYNVGVILDYNNDYIEDNEYNNSSNLGLRVKIKTTGCG